MERGKRYGSEREWEEWIIPLAKGCRREVKSDSYSAYVCGVFNALLGAFNYENEEISLSAQTK